MRPGLEGVELLAALVDHDGDDDEYRFLVDRKYVKYVTIEAGALPAEIDRSFGPDLLRVVPEFPPGDWNKGRISKGDRVGEPVFSSISTEKLPAVESVWHPILIDYLELKMVARLRQNIRKVSHVLFREPVIFKLANFPWEIPFMEAETKAYAWIQDEDIGPRFLGHVSEGGRVVGFLMEDLDEATPATLDDLEACSVALARLHDLGIQHGDVNRNNFLVRRPEGKVTIIDFEVARKCDEQEQLQAESASLEESFRDPSNRGGVCVISAS
ncbi:hypothetical protein KVR01_005125 [Diaporthe batatas]|uniref:uncharacterized protein n=1 Tax=Diaporthe batatas TaxID=748121 RepID=UPI001D04A246|nr:uncharacterized protein KVR01_005125 [Diaporthe batatas]KAG8164850.1 hypothetical protein KVR01_005125 [Diaporthe batatas]